jgi:predicted nicotinamide N-methyase
MMDQNLPFQSEINKLVGKYKLRTEEIRIKDRTFKILLPSSMDDLLDEYEKMFHEDERLPYWANLWESAVVLAEYILEEYEFHDEHVLELGSGLGLAGLAAREKGAKIIYSDYDENSFPFIKINHFMNFQEEPIVRYLDWREVWCDRQFDWIIASDIVYEPNLYPVILHAIGTLLNEKGTLLLTEPSRSFSKPFFEELIRNGFKYKTRTRKVAVDDKNSIQVTFYQIQKVNTGRMSIE